MANVGQSKDLGGGGSGSGVPSNANTHGDTSGFGSTASGLLNASGGFPAVPATALDEASDLYCVPGNLEVPNSFGRAARV